MGQIYILVYLEYSSSWQLINRLIAMLCPSLKRGHPIWRENSSLCCRLNLRKSIRHILLPDGWEGSGISTLNIIAFTLNYRQWTVYHLYMWFTINTSI